MGVFRDAIDRWIKAEYAFRLGPHAYTDVTQKYLLEAEDGLCEALTGHKGLTDAAKALGVPIRPELVPKRSNPKLVQPGDTPDAKTFQNQYLGTFAPPEKPTDPQPQRKRILVNNFEYDDG